MERNTLHGNYHSLGKVVFTQNLVVMKKNFIDLFDAGLCGLKEALHFSHCVAVLLNRVIQPCLNSKATRLDRFMSHCRTLEPVILSYISNTDSIYLFSIQPSYKVEGVVGIRMVGSPTFPIE